MTVVWVWAKELLDTLRDRRTLIAMVVGPVLVMPVFVLLPQYLVRRQAQTQEQAVIRLAVVGAQHAPDLVDALEVSGEIEILTDGDLEEMIRDDEADVGLVLPAGFERDLAEGTTAALQVLEDESEMLAGLMAERVRSLLGSYAQGVVTARLATLGVEDTLLRPFTIEDVNVATPQQMGGAFLAMMLPMFIMMWSVVGGMYTAIDVTAGEKERLTLEPLLTAPVARARVVLGKLLAVMTTSLVALILAVASMLVAFSVVPSPAIGQESALVTSTGVDARTGILLLLATVPVVILFSALEMAVCLMARSFKEAQNYIVPIQFAVLIPAMAVMVLPDLSPSLPTFAVPVFSTIIVVRDLFLGEVELAAFSVMAGTSLVYAGVAIGLAIWQFGRESVLFRM
jgi:sodium transport system permease protein